ncbi:digalactosyldiacylglycerol synthase 2, chloroplastic [Lotus japonicus]|uniref:Digalactosyldiacylglycerol synthase 2, chloroplastic n=1 Tax=Lotus japonicus TaxID=34305 RepID=DGDG2_LOTJA|nr:digalactosyldiacylglycerol synthase 2, chloroplastic [Lotus japonicus]XP_057435587.1 digalactosyldiacylglycerol synthase 2, chloroplastic [Lotus japonicus]XP_057435589.1 digalactosyldiacylglycerol synthase 2, chloroplastic [Lotus japonicus]Q6DW73.1 RecName: Full=Digalactosyldiacylglycerol synthase 2, chloroplastic [Lotus japonicus]AAT67423.1 digalactosyldiacylglycerol synthase 2 [Lotus japonicus]
MGKKQHIAIFTTASLPWLTGTAVNPLFRAAYLSKDGERDVTLVIPWLSLKDQALVYPNNITFASPSEHEKYIRQWLEERVGFTSGFSIKFYPGKFSRDKRSILAVGDISEVIPDKEADIAVLEEPEHLTWFHHGKRWKTKFRLVIGIIHTNYLEYVKREKNGQMQAFLLKYLNNWVVGIYCHKVIRLSAATQDYSGSIVCNVHGVNPKFLEIGKKKREQQQNGDQAFTKGAYFIGKMVWSKGYKELLHLFKNHQKELSALEVDLFGSGEDSDEVQKAAKKLEMAVRVHPARDHADALFHDYKLFLNPSTTDVVCTTTAEALAMGKIVVCANHCSNEFFKQFPNCWTFDESKGFVQLILKALAEEPAQLTDAQRHDLSWEAATERFLKAAELDKPFEKKLSRSTSIYMSTSLNLQQTVDDASAYVHHVASGFEISRRMFGAIPGSLKPDEELSKELGLSDSGRK